MQQIVFEREFSVQFDVVKTEYVQYSKENLLIFIFNRKKPEKNRLNFNLKKS